MKIDITHEYAKKRADAIVAAHATDYSRAALGKLFDMGNVLLDGQLAKRGDKPKEGQTIEVDLAPIEQEPDVIELPILYEDDNVIVINKPAGIISHSRGKYWQEASVASFVRAKTKDLRGERAGIVHRLDRATSGVMIAAKTEKVQAFLQDQFSRRLVKKEYTALVHGAPTEHKAHIMTGIERHPKTPQMFKVGEGGKHAETLYEIARSNAHSSFVHLWPLTGRTHQLRVHMAYIGCPIIGDVLYGVPEDINEDRMYLHAEKLTVRLPNRDETTFIAPLPEEFHTRFVK